MVSAGTVTGDASKVSEALSKYSSNISGLSGSWKGTSFDSIISKVESFVSEYQVIENQMSDFASAVTEYKAYEDLKKMIKQEEAKLSSAKEEDKATLRNNIRKMNEDLKIYKSNIEAYLSAVASVNLDASSVGSQSGSQFGLSDGIQSSDSAINVHTIISEEERAKRIAFVGGECGSEAEQDAKMTTIDVPYWNGSSESTMKITVNSNLVDNYTNVFKKLTDAHFTILPETTGAYNYYHTPRPSGAPSDHTLGSAVDVNWDNNWDTGDGSSYSVRGNEEVIEIFASEGFYWGGDWTNPDDMHFSYTGY